jgi:hypothetical protein
MTPWPDPATTEHWSIWSRADCEYSLLVPRETRWNNYGRRMVECINNLARLEHRSPLAVWVDLVGLEITP